MWISGNLNSIKCSNAPDQHSEEEHYDVDFFEAIEHYEINFSNWGNNMEIYKSLHW